MTTRTYKKADDYLLAAARLISKDGTEVSFTPYAKLLYIVMRQRFMFFKEQNKDYFDTTTNLAGYIGAEVKTVNRSIALLKAVGLLEVKKVFINNLPKNIYTSVNPPEVVLIPEDELKRIELLLGWKHSSLSHEIKTNVLTEYLQPDAYLDDCPF